MTIEPWPQLEGITLATDPLAGLHKTELVEKRDESIDFGALTESINHVREALEDCSVAAEEAIEKMPKVVQCYSCNEYAFDGALTAYMTDEGEQPFCRDCVSGIEKRSRKTETTFSWGTGSQWYTTPPYEITWNFDTSNSFDNVLYASAGA